LPVQVQYRPAVLGPGLVLLVTNESDRHLSLLAKLTNPTVKQERSYRLDVAPHATVDVGHREGWILESGDQVQISSSGYKPWQGSIP